MQRGGVKGQKWGRYRVTTCIKKWRGGIKGLWNGDKEVC